MLSGRQYSCRRFSCNRFTGDLLCNECVDSLSLSQPLTLSVNYSLIHSLTLYCFYCCSTAHRSHTNRNQPHCRSPNLTKFVSVSFFTFNSMQRINERTVACIFGVIHSIRSNLIHQIAFVKFTIRSTLCFRMKTIEYTHETETYTTTLPHSSENDDHTKCFDLLRFSGRSDKLTHAFSHYYLLSNYSIQLFQFN